LNNIYQMMISSGALKIDTTKCFTFSSGIISPIYCDTRMLISFPEYRKKIISEFLELTNKIHNIDCVAGVATGGIAWGSWLSDRLDLPFCYVRSEIKSHGTKNIIEGLVSKDSNLLLIEDVVTTGNSLGRAVSQIRKITNGNITAMCLFSYGFKESIDLLDGLKIKLYPIMDLHGLIGQISDKTQREDIVNWSNNPLGWNNERKR